MSVHRIISVMMRCWWIDPETEESSAGSVVMPDSVVGVSNPESGGLLISVQHGAGWPRKDSQVILNGVHFFETILNKEVVTLASVGNIPFEQSHMSSVNGHSAVESVMNTKTSEV